jgi:hypothetical protein
MGRRDFIVIVGRREFIAALGGAVAWPVLARAQPSQSERIDARGSNVCVEIGQTTLPRRA